MSFFLICMGSEREKVSPCRSRHSEYTSYTLHITPLHILIDIPRIGRYSSPPPFLLVSICLSSCWNFSSFWGGGLRATVFLLRSLGAHKSIRFEEFPRFTKLGRFVYRSRLIIRQFLFLQSLRPSQKAWFLWAQEIRGDLRSEEKESFLIKFIKQRPEIKDEFSNRFYGEKQ